MSSGGLPSSRRPDSDESQQHAGYICMGCRHTWSSLFALRQHQGSPYMRGTTCGSLHSAAELRNVQRSNLGTGFAQAVPIFRPGTTGRSLSRPFGDQTDSNLCIFAYFVMFLHPMPPPGPGKCPRNDHVSPRKKKIKYDPVDWFSGVSRRCVFQRYKQKQFQ